MLNCQKIDHLSAKSSIEQSNTQSEKNKQVNPPHLQSIHFQIGPEFGYSNNISISSFIIDINLKQKIRRSKKDDEGRNYNCGCGKKYLSYPALYTHIKNKHEGHTPEGTKNTNIMQQKRGRPKRQLKNLNKIQLNLSDLTILEHLQEKFEGEFNFCQFNNNKIYEKSELYKIIKKDLGQLFQQKFEQRISYKLALALFVFKLSKILNQKLFIEFYKLLQALLHCIQLNYKQVLQNCFKVNHPKMPLFKHELEQHYQDFFENESCEIIPMIGDYFLRVYLPQNYEDFNIHLAIFMFYDFCKWLHKINLSKIDLDLNLILNNS